VCESEYLQALVGIFMVEMASQIPASQKNFRGKFLVLPRAEQHSKQNQNRMMGTA
jgi:hypothetical protein